MTYKHIPVMLNEIVHYLNCSPGKTYVDCTLGGAGHAGAICKKIAPDGLLIGIDQDEEAIRNGKKVLKPYESNVRLFHDNFINTPEILSQLNIPAVDGILLDLGFSFYQIESSGRGFSFQRDEPLDMRMNLDSKTKAEDIINTAKEESLKKIFSEYGEERWAPHIARKIVQVRKLKRIDSSKQLAQIICETIPKKAAFKQKIHPATKVFMALRIAVNKELEVLASFMDNVFDALKPEGRLCVLTFHSLEDRIVKHKIKAMEGRCTCPPDFPKCVCNKKPVAISLTKKVLRPTKEEIEKNPMARSAKLRVAEKL
ncbi:MAG: 16S rRNA (cytosine(1402)-N(4))-methyltransferase RsmH [Deltaproteobacteria bacterium]|nr:16S rRNA (cytosine(1402)-N(4))-methyltransferase RsmH [Deltaproteobacteria bacterium]